jgi:hypothetical protein
MRLVENGRRSAHDGFLHSRHKTANCALSCRLYKGSRRCKRMRCEELCRNDGVVQVKRRLAIHAGHYSSAKTFHRCHPKLAVCFRHSHFWYKGAPCPLGAFMDIPTPFTDAHNPNGSFHRSSYPALPESLFRHRHLDSFARPCTHASLGSLE